MVTVTSESDPTGAIQTVAVCICTFKRPALLKRALEGLSKLETGGQFIFSIVVADNDREKSGFATVDEFRKTSSIQVVYCVEPEQNIALVRNKALENAEGDFVAFIDDDEFPSAEWLRTMLTALKTYKADGVLGPVRPHFPETPPKWLVRGKFCERPEHETGSVLQWKMTRTGNVVFRRQILEGVATPFRREFGNGGEDQDFFREMISRGRQFIWCNEGVVFETVPIERRTRRYLLKRALLRGQNEKRTLSVGSILRSLLAAPIYAIMAVLTVLIAHDAMMRYSIRFCDHIGKLLAAIGIDVIRGKYLNG